jgi:hypothetical protein
LDYITDATNEQPPPDNQGKPDNNGSIPNPDSDNVTKGPPRPAAYPKPDGGIGGPAGIIAGAHSLRINVVAAQAPSIGLGGFSSTGTLGQAGTHI